MTDLVDIHQMLARYEHFGECLITSVTFSNYGTGLLISIEHPSLDDRTEPETGGRCPIVILRFDLVEEFTVENALPAGVVADPQLIGWSRTELAKLEIRNFHSDERSGRFEALFWWERSCWMRVVFSKFRLSEVVDETRRSLLESLWHQREP